jgi:hypothetical protein
MKKLLYIVGCLLVLSTSPVLAQGKEPSVVVVRTFETDLGKPQIFIVRETGTQEIKVKTEEYLTTYRKVIADLYGQWYTLQSSVEARSEGPYRGTMIFVKPAKP